MVEKELSAENQLREQVKEMIRKIINNWNDSSQLCALLNEWEEKFGPEATDIAQEVIAEQTHKGWASVAEREQCNTIGDLIRFLWEPFRNQGAEFTVEEIENGIQVYCTYCPIAEAYRKIKKEEYGLLFNCSEDPHIVEGFNPRITFKRTKTLMEGHDCCDHRYTLEK